MKTRDKWLNMLLVMGTLLSFGAKSKAEEKGNGNSFSVNMPYNLNIEKTESEGSFGEVCLKPGFTWQNGDWNGEFRWNAYNSATVGEKVPDWSTTKLMLKLGYQDWALIGGLHNLNSGTAPYIAFPMTASLDNKKVGYGQNWRTSGVGVSNENLGLYVGIDRDDDEVSLKGMNNLVVSYKKPLGDKVNASVFAAFNANEINRAGVNLAYHPTPNTSFVADYTYKDKQSVYTLGGSYKFDGKHTASLVGEMIDPFDGHTYTRISAGLDYQIADNLSVTGAISHDFDSHDTKVGVVLRLSGDISKQIKAITKDVVQNVFE